MWISDSVFSKYVGLKKKQYTFCSKLLAGDGSLKTAISKAHFTSCHPTHVHDNHMFLLAKRACFRAAGNLPTFRSVSEDKSGL